MSESQNTFLLLTEGILMSLIASLLGMGLGFELLKLSEPWLISMLKLESFFAVHFYPKAALYTTVICMGVTLFSLIEPARLSAQVSPLEALHGVMAKELTVVKAIKLLAGKITGKKSKKKEKPSIAERLGVVISLLLSYIVFQKWIIDAAEAEGYVFAWPVGAAILIVFGMFGIIAAVNLLEWKRSMQDGKR